MGSAGVSISQTSAANVGAFLRQLLGVNRHNLWDTAGHSGIPRCFPVNITPTATPPRENQSAAHALLDDVEVALRLNVSLQTVRNWRTRGEGPRYVKLGKRAVRYRPEDVEAFIEGERMCA